MRPLLVRLAILTLGMGVTEIGLTEAFGRGSPGAWALVLAVGFPLIIVGTMGLIGPLLAGRHKGDQ
ncbi:MAG: hypothetical protein HY262_00455 [Chloroflexi bacterium]|nr:hypothetical protein [Chloroflexota bacterium]